MFVWGVFKSTVQWAFLLALVGVAIGTVTVGGAAALGVLYLCMLLVTVIVLAIKNARRSRYERRNPFKSAIVGIPWDFNNPFRGLTAPFGKRLRLEPKGYYRTTGLISSWFHFIWSVVLLLAVALTLAAWLL